MSQPKQKPRKRFLTEYSFEIQKHVVLVPVIVVKRVGIEVPLIVIPVHVERDHFCALYHLCHRQTKVTTFKLNMFSDIIISQYKAPTVAILKI
jgi:hypothetical protein